MFAQLQSAPSEKESLFLAAEFVGSDPEGRDAEGNTPMSLAEAGQHMGCLRMMRIYQERAVAATVVNGERAHRRTK